jgi:hypothetical protein
MQMKIKLFLPAAILLVIGTLSLGATPGQDGQASEKTLRLNLEIYGGFAAIHPADLNLQANYYNAYPLFFYTRQYDYLHAQYGNNFTYSSNRSGDDRLKTVNSGFPCGVRLRYVLSPALSLSVGLEYLQENRLSGTSIRYQIDDHSQGLIQTTPQEVEASYPDFFLGVSAWIPQIGIHLAKLLGERWQVSGSFSAGPLLARCRSVVETRYKSRYSNGYWSENYYLLEMKGAGTGLALDLSAELRHKLTRRLSFFLASGYAWRRAVNIKGAGHNQSLFLDSNATQDLVENSWEGRWRKKEAIFSRNWGQFAGSYYGNYFADSEDTTNFVLNLSGFQVKAGFSWAF